MARNTWLRCIYGTFCRDFIKNTVIFGVYIQFWPILAKWHEPRCIGSSGIQVKHGEKEK